MMLNVVKISDRVDVIRCKNCLYFNDMSDIGKSSFCWLHSDHSEDDGDGRLFYTNPDGYCAWADINEMAGHVIPDVVEF